LIKLPKPNRHHHCFYFAGKDLGIDLTDAAIGISPQDQGFYTETGKFLDRREALKYVERTKQKTIRKPNKYLFSEDLW